MKTIIVGMDDILTYGNFSKILGEKKDDFFSKFKDTDMYASATLLPDCYEVLKELINTIKFIYAQIIFGEK